MSVVAIATKALQDLHATLTYATPLPALWADKVPVKGGTGTASALPYIVISGEDGAAPAFMSGLDRVETVRVKLEVYDRTKAGVKAIVKGVSYNGAAPASRAGFDDAAALTLPTGYFLNKCERVSAGTVTQEDARSDTAGLVFEAVLLYDVELFIDGTLAV